VKNINVRLFDDVAMLMPKFFSSHSSPAIGMIARRYEIYRPYSF